MSDRERDLTDADSLRVSSAALRRTADIIHTTSNVPALTKSDVHDIEAEADRLDERVKEIERRWNTRAKESR